MVITSLSVGRDYNLLTSRLLALLSTCNEVVVSTSSPIDFPPKIPAVKCPEDGTPIWHRKRFAIRVGLERSRSVLFIDGDHRVYPYCESKVTPIPSISFPGFVSRGIMPVRSLHPNLKLFGQPPLSKYLDKASSKFGIDWKNLWWWGDYLFAIVDTEDRTLGSKFVDFWDRFACWVRDEVVFENPGDELTLADGVAMAYAAAYCGIPPRVEKPLFLPIINCFQHLCKGYWRTPAKKV